MAGKRRPGCYTAYHFWIRRKPCPARGHPLHECVGAVEGHHLKRVGNGGIDYRNEVPACVQLHTEFHSGESRTCEKYDLPPVQEVADELGDEWDRTFGKPDDPTQIPKEVTF